MTDTVDLPGAAHLVLAGGVAHLDPTGPSAAAAQDAIRTDGTPATCAARLRPSTTASTETRCARTADPENYTPAARADARTSPPTPTPTPTPNTGRSVHAVTTVSAFVNAVNAGKKPRMPDACLPTLSIHGSVIAVGCHRPAPAASAASTNRASEEHPASRSARPAAHAANGNDYVSSAHR